MLGRVFTIFTVVFSLTNQKVEGQPDFFRPDSPSDLSESITEDLSAGTSIYNVFATGGSGPLIYSIQSQSPTTPAFTLTPTTSSADLYTPSGTALDRETVDAFEFVFSVTDGTDTVLSDTFTVNILDVNDNAPQFENTTYTASVFETVADGYSVLTVSATDADLTTTLKYYVKAGDTSNTFSMGQTSGELTVVTSANLQASTTPSYALRVEVEDNFGTNTGTATINISVKDDPCSPQPCLNSGTCSISGTNYTCNCMSGYLGDTCNTVDQCESSPCLNGATCARNSADYTCTCTSGWLGTNCSTADPCDPNPCQNSGTCSISGSSYSCTCASGFTGSVCSDIVTTASASGASGSNATESPPGDDEKRTTLIVVTVLGGVLLVAVVVFIVYKNKPANVSFIGKYRRGSTVFPKREKTLSSITLRMNGKVDTSVNTDTQFNKQSYVEGTRTNEVSNNHLTRQSST
ncbi:delta-like protein A [Mya arenaria]|uniref:delta-like protein A n=1 Tax=Mya arenaria TaxID=6604 RepID=UPI0022E61F60|nr:delta-like protein A [Mya arenaria]XP_052763754.1 delta-like protein A [Mya arenaria]XP_052763755.1 delta-like protein A [Mya arenaria]XP_052763756.1 delta-like protein A [Mya arenaria]XP_052763757.1 delta-like protein A [Mya arenaria]